MGQPAGVVRQPGDGHARPTKEGNEPKPLAFDAKSEAKLTNWNVQWDIGSADTRPSFATGTNDGLRWLEIKAGKNFGRGLASLRHFPFAKLLLGSVPCRHPDCLALQC